MLIGQLVQVVQVVAVVEEDARIALVTDVECLVNVADAKDHQLVDALFAKGFLRKSPQKLN